MSIFCVHRSQSLFYFILQESHSQAGSAMFCEGISIFCVLYVLCFMMVLLCFVFCISMFWTLYFVDIIFFLFCLLCVLSRYNLPCLIFLCIYCALYLYFDFSKSICLSIHSHMWTKAMLQLHLAQFPTTTFARTDSKQIHFKIQNKCISSLALSLGIWYKSNKCIDTLNRL